MAGAEDWPQASEYHHPHLVVGLRLEKRFVQLDEHAPILGVPGIRPVHENPGYLSVVQGLIGKKLIVWHLALLKIMSYAGAIATRMG